MHNLITLNKDIKENGVGIFDAFNSSQENTINHYKKVILAIEEAWPENPLIDDLKIGLDELLEYA